MFSCPCPFPARVCVSAVIHSIRDAIKENPIILLLRPSLLFCFRLVFFFFQYKQSDCVQWNFVCYVLPVFEWSHFLLCVSVVLGMVSSVLPFSPS